MIFADDVDHKAATALFSFLDDNSYTITNAMRVYAERMEENAAAVEAEWQRGQDNPEVKAAQDASMFTNAGHLQAARMASESAKRARHVADELTRLIDALTEDPDE
jgi:hypothetical protein